MASKPLIDQLTECAKSSRTSIELGSANLSIESSGWFGKADADQMMVSARIQDGNLGNILDALTGTFTSSELSLPDWLAKAAGTIVLRHLSAGFERTNGKINFTAFSFGLDVRTGGWVLVDNLLTITELKADFSVLLPSDPELRQIQLSVGGKLSFASAPITITATSFVRPGPPPAQNVADLLKKTDLLIDDDEKDYPDLFQALTDIKLEQQTRFDFAIEGRLMPNNLTLADVIRHFGWATSGSHDNTVPDDPLARIAIRALEMRASTATGSFEFLLDLGEADKPKELPFGKISPLKLKDLYLHVEGSADHGFAGTLGCELEFDGNLRVPLRASCDLASGGWIFAGGLNLESGSRLRESIQKTFGITLPDFVENLEARPGEKALSADFEFNTSTREVNLSLQVGLKIGDNQAAARLDIGISPGDSGCVVSGAVDLGGKHFSLTYESLGQGQASALIATYTEHDTEPLDLGAVFGNLAGVDLHGLKLAIPGAVFAWQQDKDGRKGVKLLGLNVQGGLDLAAIKVSEYLPLVRNTAEAGISAKLDFQVVLTDRPWTDKDEALRAAIALRGFALTDTSIGAGVNLRAQLRLGNETRTLNAPASAQNSVVPAKIANEAQKNQPNNVPEPQPAQDDTHWLDLHRKIGPLRFERIGLQFLTKPDARVALLLDAGFEFAGLQVSVDGLKVESPLSLTQFAPKFSLSGLGISYRNPAIEIGGALLLVENGFAGKVIVKGKKFSLSAMGVFQVVDPDKQPSLFIYATLDAALGGPPFFYVTGLAAGIGYNRDVLLPEAEGVKDFPLVQWVLPPDEKPVLAAPKRDDPLAAIRSLTKVMPVAIGKGFAAIGVHFTSFKVLDSFVLLVAKFGPHFELDVLGISTLVSPPGDGAVRVVNATLLLRAKFAPDEGILAVRAVLAADSYVLSQSCHLGGGFAFSAWFRDQLETATQPKITAGDFVVTLGGYHPEFQRPAHYPTVPRLSLEWSVNENLSLKGSAYFALTGSHIMAGGRFEAAWISEDVRAMFVAQADFLMTWKPYHYDVKMHVAIAAEITLRRFCNFHASLDASADVHLWGPEFSGSVRVHVVVLGFDLPLEAEFGKAPKPKAIDWPLFRKSFLPEPKDGTIFAFGVRSGLQGTEPEPRKFPIVSRDALTLAFETPIPLSEMPIRKAGEGSLSKRPAIAPMGLAAEHFTSQLQFKFWFGDSPETEPKDELQLLELVPGEGGVPKYEDGAVVRKLNYNPPIGLVISPIRKAMPAAIWGPSITSDAPDGGIYLEHQPLNAPRVVEDLVVGFEIIPFAILSAAEMADKGVPVTSKPSKDEISVPLAAPKAPPDTSGEFYLQRREMLLRAYGLTPDVIAA